MDVPMEGNESYVFGVDYATLPGRAMVVRGGPRALRGCDGQTLATKPEDPYRARREATAFGTRTIGDAFRSAGVPVQEFIVAGACVGRRR